MNKLFWKLQSINQSDKLEIHTKEFEMYREKFKKNFETRELMTEVETVEHYDKLAWKSPLFSKIYSLTLAFVNDGVVRIKYITGTEKDLIQTFLNEIKGEHFKDYQLVHSDAEYMLPYLGTRMDLNGFRTSTHKDLQYKGLRPWNLTGISVRDYYQGAGNYKHSLKEIAWVYGIDAKFIENADEFDFYRAGKVKELQDSAVNEIFTLVNVYRIMMGEEAVTELTVTTEVVNNVEEVKPTNFLNLLWQSQAMTLKVRNGLEKQLTKKKLTKRDKEVVREIILGVYLQNDFINGQQDSKATVEKKTKEVDDFLNSIK